MSGIKYVLSVSGADGDNPLISGTPRENLQRLGQVFKDMACGGKNSVYSIDCRSSAVAASATATLASVQSGDTVTINGTALTATQHYATGTVTCASVADADTATVAGVVLTAKTTPAAVTDWARGGTDTADALALVACINANCTTVTATSALGVVTVRAASVGTGGNAITLATSNNTRLAKSGTTLANGAAIGNNEFDFTGTDTQDAAAFVTAVGASSTALISGQVTATSALGVVTLTSKVPGTVGNMQTLVSSNGTRLAVTGSGRLTGGTETAFTMSF